ncbi:undecaprenyl-diphosphatase [Raineyella antarctica]|uniref:Undecaprenyl-diphosphatase n=1 Tax=Raineyella antarctica TaxID=1577474 RepID=A0A1G6HJQ5_9ACTN|nr:phosphatase PAP2 family protein [Raineyella antarctica]SDB94434.1 undecaprenyl-diphosphatase [Raineyella antarctica]
MSNQAGGPPEDVGKGVAGELGEDRLVGGRDLTRWKSPPGHWLAGIAHRMGLVLGPRQILVLILAIGVAIAATMTWAASEVYEAVAAANGVALLDQPLLAAMMGLRSPWLDSFATAYTNLGGAVGMPIAATAIMVMLAIRRRSWTPVILITAAGAGSLLMTIAGKQLIGRARPPLVDAVPPYEYSPAFPSGHSLNSLVIAGIVAYLLLLRQRRRWAWVLTVTVAALFAFTIGVSRVFLGHHWFTDVLGAWFLGAAWLAMVITAHRLYLTETQRRIAGTVGDVP